MDLNNDCDDDVDEDENDEDPEEEEEAAGERRVIGQLANDVADHVPVVHHHLLEKHHHRRRVVIEVHQVVEIVAFGHEGVERLVGHLAAEKEDAKLRELVDHQVQEEQLREDRPCNHRAACE